MLQCRGSFVHQLLEALIPLLESNGLLLRELAEPPVFQQHLRVGQCGGHYVTELVRVTGFGDKAGHLALIHHACGGREIGIAGRQDSCGVGPPQAHSTQQIGTVHTRHRA